MSHLLSKAVILFISGQSWENQTLAYLEGNKALAVGQQSLMEKLLLTPVLTITLML